MLFTITKVVMWKIVILVKWWDQYSTWWILLFRKIFQNFWFLLKAFDGLEWEFLVSCLETFNFGWDFIHWMKVLYKNIQSWVINNCLSSDNFCLERGVRQDDLLSPYLFVLAAEVLAVSIRQNSNIKGISIGKEETKIFFTTKCRWYQSCISWWILRLSIS